MGTPINTISDLREEIARLRVIEDQQSVALVARVNSPAAIFATVMSLFAGKEDLPKPGIFSQDFLGLLSRVVLPITLNKTLFKHSNFLIKTVVGLLSQKASTYISEESVGGVWNKLKSLLNKVTKKKEETPAPSKMPQVPPPIVM